jgi:hypothetical protein
MPPARGRGPVDQSPFHAGDAGDVLDFLRVIRRAVGAGDVVEPDRRLGGVGLLPLEKVVKFFEGQTMENFVLDPAGRKAGALDPGATISGEAKEEPLGEAVDRLLRPLGLHLEIRDEVVVISRLP